VRFKIEYVDLKKASELIWSAVAQRLSGDIALAVHDKSSEGGFSNPPS
jgi:hypothetical protein